MSDCGGSFTTQRVTVTNAPTQALSAIDTREAVTLRADGNNTGNIYIIPRQSAPVTEGFPLSPNDVYSFDKRGSRAPLYLIAAGGTQLVYIITEGA